MIFLVLTYCTYTVYFLSAFLMQLLPHCLHLARIENTHESNLIIFLSRSLMCLVSNPKIYKQMLCWSLVVNAYAHAVGWKHMAVPIPSHNSAIPHVADKLLLTQLLYAFTYLYMCAAMLLLYICQVSQYSHWRGYRVCTVKGGGGCGCACAARALLGVAQYPISMKSRLW